MARGNRWPMLARLICQQSRQHGSVLIRARQQTRNTKTPFPSTAALPHACNLPCDLRQGSGDLWPYISASSLLQRRHVRTCKRREVNTQRHLLSDAECVWFSLGSVHIHPSAPQALIGSDAALPRHWLKRFSWSMRWRRLSWDKVAWWHWQSRHHQCPRMHGGRERERDVQQWAKNTSV